MSDKTPTLRTSDFRMAGYVRAHGGEMVTVEKGDRGQTVFVFNDDDGAASRLVAQYPGSAEERYDAMCRTMLNLTKTERRG